LGKAFKQRNWERGYWQKYYEKEYEGSLTYFQAQCSTVTANSTII
jgi:hypothetical protein